MSPVLHIMMELTGSCSRRSSAVICRWRAGVAFLFEHGSKIPDAAHVGGFWWER